MDSINRQQPEDNRDNLQGGAALDKLRLLAEKADNCFFCTRITTGEQFNTRPMAILQVDDMGNCWFLSAIDSEKNSDIAADPAVQLLFKGSDHSDFMSIYGQASISQDKEKIKELWNPLIKTWFTEGIDDPRITVIRVVPSSGYYWDTKHGQIVAFAKQIVGAVTGKTLDDSVEGTLDV
ncbi:pyridoxamine 5'-phosphate oxidase family protein [Chitinophaga agrisoli]|uniref:Pyridoxamine 5'-phosphate oxidase family protein n=1 Tax=Chitinophaga agrisoli TaxID=2607653 RepID=A0A5B2VWE8_9BACT|nr:pyridoxamine 5'-phosphate oxidase family protein [Chitinophaga agrisoli]KAA2242970.1 pyridoxamine 5'-phosphate oxidase family protein [Chitinophaga agrisoli]